MSQKQTARYARRINKVIDHIRRHLDDELDVARLSELAHFSSFHFHRQFSSYSGISVYRLVQLLQGTRTDSGGFSQKSAMAALANGRHRQDTKGAQRHA